MKKVVLILSILAAGCTKQPATSSADPAAALVSKGAGVYLSNCTTCHNSDPAKDGAVGPAIAGSSRELVEARLLHLEYPAGYTPKRTTKAMTAFPQLAGDIDALTAYLASKK